MRVQKQPADLLKAAGRARVERIIFRVDSGRQIGNGHLMRCLSLAEALQEDGAFCRFICREQVGHRIDLVAERGFQVDTLPLTQEDSNTSQSCENSPYGSWLGCSLAEDVKQTIEVLKGDRPAWLVVDHYGLDASWETRLRPHCQRIAVIDDLVDRLHDADMLLDQNLGRTSDEYVNLVPDLCDVLVGPRYALLRPEFHRLRQVSLDRRKDPQLNQILVSMGGVDTDNATEPVLDALTRAKLPRTFRVVVALGSKAPNLEAVRKAVDQLPWPSRLETDATNVAQLMLEADLAIGAAGTMSWERCCLGLPSLVAVLADNQKRICDALVAAGAAISIGSPRDTSFVDCASLQVRRCVESTDLLRGLAENAATVTDGCGTRRVAHYILDSKRHENIDFVQ